MAKGGRSPLRLLTNAVRRRAINQGLLGGDRAWRVVGVAWLGKRILSKLSGSEPVVIANEKLEPGQELQIWAIPTPKEQAKIDKATAKRVAKLEAEARREAESQAAADAKKAAKRAAKAAKKAGKDADKAAQRAAKRSLRQSRRSRQALG